MSMKSIELFAGAGGLALGLEEAGFDHIGLIESDKVAAATLSLNRPSWNVICEDISIVSSRDLEKEFNIKKYELDLLSGGAPCQSFSYAGKRLGLEDTRGTMFYHYATFLNKLQPKMFLFENVKGLLTHNSGKTFKTIYDIFNKQGYLVYYKVLNANDFDVPQKRERLIVVGIREDLVKGDGGETTTTTSTSESGKGSGSDGSNYVFKFPVSITSDGSNRNRKLTLRDVKLDSNPSKDEYQRYSSYKESVFKLVPPGGYWKDIDQEVARKYMKSCYDNKKGGRTGILRRLSLDEPCLTVLTSPSMKQTDRCHPLEVRPFTYRENARIQTFPDSWQFVGTLSQKYKQVGNAVPVNLAKAIGISIKETLMELKGRKGKH